MPHPQHFLPMVEKTAAEHSAEFSTLERAWIVPQLPYDAFVCDHFSDYVYGFPQRLAHDSPRIAFLASLAVLEALARALLL